MPKGWNTWRIALWGTIAGAVYWAVNHGSMFFSAPISQGLFSFEAGELIASLLGGALLFAAVSVLRNLILRAR